MEISNQEKLNDILKTDISIQNEELIQNILEQEDNFEYINYLKFRIKRNEFSYFLNGQMKITIIKIVQDIWESHIKLHYLKSLIEFVEDNKYSENNSNKSLLIYNFVEDYEYELSYESAFDKYLFKDENNKEYLNNEFTQELIKLIKEL